MGDLYPINIAPGLFLNRTAYSSKLRWIDGDFVRFRDGVPQQVGGWERAPLRGIQAVPGKARAALAWRPNNQSGSYMALGSEQGAFVFDGGRIANVTPDSFLVGREDSLRGAGYGGGLYGVDAYGTPRAFTGNELEAAFWTFDSWGEIVIGSYSANGVMYEYAAGEDKFTPVANAPTCRSVIVTDERYIFAIGANGEPASIKWCDQEDRNTWTPLATNRAGGYFMQTETRLQCGRRVRGGVLVWSETDLWVFFPLSNSLVYGYERAGTNCGVLSPHAAVVVGEVAYWMSQDGFYAYDGIVRRLECDIYDYVFGALADINLTQRVKFQAKHNSLFEEIWFFYCSSGSNEIDRAAVFNYRNGTWTKCTLPRTTWHDRGVFDRPIAIGVDGKVFRQELGHSADGALIPSYVKSHPIELRGGNRAQHISAFWPDAQMGGGSAILDLEVRFTPQAPPMMFGPYTFTGDTERIMLSVAARQVAIRIGAANPGDHWELGEPRFEIGAGGKR